MSNQDALNKCLSKVKDDKLDEYVDQLGMDLINPVTKDTAYDTYVSNLKKLYDTLNNDNGNIAKLEKCITPTNYGLIFGIIGGVVGVIILIVFIIWYYNSDNSDKSERKGKRKGKRKEVPVELKDKDPWIYH